jgi:hypothetical protein
MEKNKTKQKKTKPKHTTLSEQFQNLIERSLKDTYKYTLKTEIHGGSLSWLSTGTY